MMATKHISSFQKQSTNKVPYVLGSKISIRNSQLLISSGVPSFDFVIGGGIPVGTLVLVEEDAYGRFSRVLLKYFLSEGVMSKHSLLVASQDRDPEKIVQELPDATGSGMPEQLNPELDDKMTIAWRYQGLKTVDSSPSSTTFGHHFDLSKTMDAEKLSNTDTHFWKPSVATNENLDSAFKNPQFEDLLLRIQKTIDEGGFNLKSNPEKRNILRIAINSLGSPLWSGNSDSLDGISLESDMSLFLYSLRGLVRSSYAVCMLTVPTLLYQEELSLVKRCQHLCDTCVRLESFAGSDKETNPAFKDYHGLFHVTKLSAINTIPCHIPESLDLAFKLRRKKFLIEKLHLPPELQETAQREQDDLYQKPKSGGGCGSGPSKNLLDF